MTWFDQLSAWLTQRKWAAIVFIITLIPVIFPLGTPMTVGFETEDFKEEIDALAPGSIVVIGEHGGGIPAPRSGRTSYVALFNYLMERELKLVFLCFYHDTPLRQEAYLTLYVKPEENYGYVYGTDYVIYPFTAGEEIAMATLAADMWAAPADYLGKPFTELPLMANIRSFDDVDLCIVGAGHYTVIDMFVRQWPQKYGTTTLNTYSWGSSSAYYGTYVHGVLDGTRGWAEFMYLTGFPGESIINNDARNITVTLVLISVIIGNIGYWTTRRGRGEIIPPGAHAPVPYGKHVEED